MHRERFLGALKTKESSIAEGRLQVALQVFKGFVRVPVDLLEVPLRLTRPPPSALLELREELIKSDTEAPYHVSHPWKPAEKSPPGLADPERYSCSCGRCDQSFHCRRLDSTAQSADVEAEKWRPDC